MDRKRLPAYWQHDHPQLTERELMKLLLDLEQRIVACEQLLGLGESEARPRLKLVKGHRHG